MDLQSDISFLHTAFAAKYPFFFLLYYFIFLCFPLVFLFPASLFVFSMSFLPFSLNSFSPTVFLNVSPSVGVQDGKSEMFEWNQPHFCSVCVCVCAQSVHMRERAELLKWDWSIGWSWEGQRGRLGLIPTSSVPSHWQMPSGWPSVCDRPLAFHREKWRAQPGFYPNSLSIFYQANFGHVSDTSRRAAPAGLFSNHCSFYCRQTGRSAGSLFSCLPISQHLFLSALCFQSSLISSGS